MKFQEVLACCILALIGTYYSALVLWLDYELSTFSDLLSQGVLVPWLGGSALWLLVLVALIQLIYLRRWPAFFVCSASISLAISLIISLHTGNYGLLSMAWATLVIWILIIIGTIVGWILPKVVDSIIRISLERIIP